MQRRRNAPMSTFSKRIVFLALILTFSLPLLAQGALGQLLQSKPASVSKTQPDALGRETPYGTIFGFLEAAQSGSYSIAAQYLQMNPARRQAEGDALAQKLQAAMNAAFAGNLKPSRDPEGTPQEGVPPDRQKLGTMAS